MAGPGWIVTPQGTLDYMNEVDRYIVAIGDAVGRQGLKVPGPTLVAWWKFAADWKAFYEAHKDFVDRLSGSVADTTERYETDATQWKNVLAGFIALDNVVFDPNKKPGGPSLEGLGDSLPWVAIIAVVLAGAVVLRK